MANLSRRLAKLEDTTRPDGRVIVMWRHVDETNAQARARWRKEHPCQSDAADLKVMIVRWSKREGQGRWPAAEAPSEAVLPPVAVCAASRPLAGRNARDAW